MKYNPERTEQKLRDAKSAVRWLILAVIFMLTAAIGQLVWFVMLVTKNPNAKAAFIVFAGAWVLGTYCKWCSDDAKPESF